MDLVKRIQANKFLKHLLFWSFIFLFYRFFFEYSTNNGIEGVWFAALLLPVTMLITYFFIYFLIPKYLLNREKWKFGLYSLITFVISVDLIGLVVVFYFLFWADLESGRMPFVSKQFIYIVALVYLIVILVCFYKVLSENFKQEARNKELQNKVLATQLELKNQELTHLKKQLHPHFLFNTLNTIYGFALKQSEETPEIILKLSNLLDYILYQVNKPQVLLNDEIAHLKEYVALEKIRFQDTLEIDFETDDFSEHDTVPPLLFIPFVENAFKHGSIIDGSLKIHIAIKKEQRDLRLLVSNSYRIDEDDDHVGIGLENSKKQLDLLFENQYDLCVAVEKNEYKVDLKILNILN